MTWINQFTYSSSYVHYVWEHSVLSLYLFLQEKEEEKKKEDEEEEEEEEEEERRKREDQNLRAVVNTVMGYSHNSQT